MNQHMHMIWHHTPRQQFITSVVKMKHGVLGQLGDAWITQMTLTNSTIQILLQLHSLLAAILNLQQVLPFAAPRFRHGIGKAKGDELDKAGKVAVRQVPTLVPAEKTEDTLMLRQLPARPTIFPGHQLAQIFTLRFRMHNTGAPGKFLVMTSTCRDSARRSITSAAMA